MKSLFFNLPTSPSVTNLSTVSGGNYELVYNLVNLQPKIYFYAENVCVAKKNVDLF